MSRLPDLRPDNLSAEQKSVVDAIVSGPHARVVGPFLAWLESPELAKRARNLSEFIRFKSSVPQRLMELGILIAGRFWKADFEYYAHAQLARKAGLDDAIIKAIASKSRPSFKNAEDEAVYNLAMELLDTKRISDSTFDHAVELLGRTAVVELVATVGYYSMVSLTLNAFGVPLPPGEKSPFPDA